MMLLNCGILKSCKMAYQYLPGQHLVRIWKPLIIFGGTEQLMRLILMTGKKRTHPTKNNFQQTLGKAMINSPAPESDRQCGNLDPPASSIRRFDYNQNKFGNFC